jgi:hypothetical protein
MNLSFYVAACRKSLRIQNECTSQPTPNTTPPRSRGAEAGPESANESPEGRSAQACEPQGEPTTTSADQHDNKPKTDRRDNKPNPVAAIATAGWE